MAMQPLDKGCLDRGVLRETMMPAALVELGFIDSADVWLLKEHQKDMAKALALGIMDFWKTV
jgi:N-acetylmuramoyl-L-alanine amidase